MTSDLSGAGLWIAVTDKIGHINQCVALTDALRRKPDRIAQIAGFNLRHNRLVKLIRRVPGVAQSLRLVIGAPRGGRLVLVISGRSSELAAALLRRRMGDRLYVVSVGVPIRHLAAIDLAVVNEAELPKWRQRRQVAGAATDEIVIIGALARRFLMAPAHGGERPLTAVLIGGENKDFLLSGVHFRAQMDRIRAIAGAGQSEIEVVLSRRTSAATEALIRDAFAGAPVIIHGRESSESYRALLGKADRFVVTPDSVTMLSEVCLAGKPVYALKLEVLPGSDGGGPRLVEAMVARGAVRMFEGEIADYTPPERLDEAARIAPLIEARIKTWAMGQTSSV